MLCFFVSSPSKPESNKNSLTTRLRKKVADEMQDQQEMDRMMMEVNSLGKTDKDIAQCFTQTPLQPKIVESIKSAHALGWYSSPPCQNQTPLAMWVENLIVLFLVQCAAGKKLHFVLVIDIQQERQIPSTTKVQVFINIHREMGWAPCCDQTNVKKGPMPPEEHAKQKEHMGYASDLFYLLKSSLRESTVAGQLRGP
ncbi:unnamed protein product [Linum tenue]|uniref:Uncharacterized protein n=2 Tax=Linum tenue TaxID=586396 RepID=A0AAV0RLS0_9ROSI|nr:unnamed protein product [Linum tenue]